MCEKTGMYVLSFADYLYLLNVSFQNSSHTNRKTIRQSKSYNRNLNRTTLFINTPTEYFIFQKNKQT